MLGHRSTPVGVLKAISVVNTKENSRSPLLSMPMLSWLWCNGYTRPSSTLSQSASYTTRWLPPTMRVWIWTSAIASRISAMSTRRCCKTGRRRRAGRPVPEGCASVPSFATRGSEATGKNRLIPSINSEALSDFPYSLGVFTATFAPRS